MRCPTVGGRVEAVRFGGRLPDAAHVHAIDSQHEVTLDDSLDETANFAGLT